MCGRKRSIVVIRTHLEGQSSHSVQYNDAIPQTSQPHLIGSRVGDINPRFSSIVPEHTHSLAPAEKAKQSLQLLQQWGEGGRWGLLVSQHQWNGAIQRHLVIQLVLKHVKVVESVRVTATAG